MSYNSICVVQLNRIGDLILITPLFRALRERFPKARLHLLAGRRNFDVGLGHPLIDRVHVYRKSPWSVCRLLLALRKERFDVWIDPIDHFSRESRLFAKASGAKFRIGFDPEKTGAFHSCVETAKEHPGAHYAERSLRALRPLGIESHNLRPVLFTRPQSDEKLRFFLKSIHCVGYCLANISSNGIDRCWPVQNWIRFFHDTGSEEAFLLTFLPRDQKTATQIAAQCPNVHLYPCPSVVDIFSAVQKARRVVTVDTSLVHIASAFNTPILALYANFPDFYRQYLPLSSVSQCVWHDSHAAPVSAIPVDLVLKEWRDLFARLQTPAAS